MARYGTYAIYGLPYMTKCRIWHFCRGSTSLEVQARSAQIYGIHFCVISWIDDLGDITKLLTAIGSSGLYLFILIEYSIYTGCWTTYIDYLKQGMMYVSLKSAECRWKCASNRPMNEISGAKREHGVQYWATATWSVLGISSGFTSMKISVVIPCFALFAELVLHEKEV